MATKDKAQSFKKDAKRKHRAHNAVVAALAQAEGRAGAAAAKLQVLQLQSQQLLAFAWSVVQRIAEDKRAAKCTLKKSPRCYKLQGRFLQIQAGIADDRDKLMEEIEAADSSCKDTKKTLQASIEADSSLLSSSQTKLAAATEKEASAGTKGRQVAQENKGYNDDLLKQMKICSQNYIDFETELCALKKIRGDVFKKMKKGSKGFFQDCEVTKWVPEACSAKCAGGDQKLSRNVMTHPGGEDGDGAKCLPLSAEKRCNRSPCPVDCHLEPWSGWSKCSSKCGGGLATRVRDVKVAMKYGGKPCSSTSEAKQCNVAACEKDCVLHEWTKWTSCSKHCDGGSAELFAFHIEFSFIPNAVVPVQLDLLCRPRMNKFSMLAKV